MAIFVPQIKTIAEFRFIQHKIQIILLWFGKQCIFIAYIPRRSKNTHLLTKILAIMNWTNNFVIEKIL